MQDTLRRNHVTLRGVGPADLVFGHGFGCDQSVWDRVVERFEADHRCVLYDYVGCGRSELTSYDPERYGSLHGYARDLIEIGEALGLRGATFVGHSSSAMIGVLANLAAPTMFSRMVLLAPSPRYLNDLPYVGGFTPADITALLDLMDHNFMDWSESFSQFAAQDAAVAGTLRDALRASRPEITRRFAEVVFNSDLREDLPRVTAHCLVVQCAEDDIAPVSVGEYVAARIPNAEYRLLQATGHLPHLTDSAAVSALIREFLEAPTRA